MTSVTGWRGRGCCKKIPSLPYTDPVFSTFFAAGFLKGGYMPRKKIAKNGDFKPVRVLARRVEPMPPPPGLLDPPSDLTDEQRGEWMRVLAAAHEAGHTIRPADRACLWQYVTVWAEHHKAYRVVQVAGPVFEYSNDMVGPSPHYRVWMDTGRRLEKLLNELGATPKARDYDRKASTAALPPTLEV